LKIINRLTPDEISELAARMERDIA
jgi:hypothetical protein